MSAPIIQSDLPCRACGYNLRGLPVEHVCPECGEPTARTVAEAPASRFPEGADLRHARRAMRFMPAAESAGCSVDGVMFVFDALNSAHWLLAAFTGSHMNAVQACGCVRAHALRYFNDAAEARDLLAEWGIRRSEDVGRIVFALVHQGLLRASPEDSPSDFDGLFTLETLFDKSRDAGQQD